MDTQGQKTNTTAERSQYTQTFCQPQFEIFKDYTRYSELVYTLPSLDGLEQWALEAIVANLDPGEDICQIVVSPQQPINDPSWASINGYADQQSHYEWVLVLTRENLVLLSCAHSIEETIVQKVPIANILSIIWERILLQSWVDWSWTDGGEVEHARINFNTVGERPIEETLGYIFESNISKMRKSGRLLVEQSQNLSILPDKFVDHLPILLTLQEKILETADYPFQPAVWKSWHGLFQKQERKAIPATALLLTERQFIMIRETDHDAWLGLGFDIYAIQRKYILNLFIENTLDGPQLILLYGDENAEERLLIRISEIYFDEIVEKFRSYLAFTPLVVL